MRTVILIYLLGKSALGRTFSRFDVRLAEVAWLYTTPAPDWLKIITNSRGDVKLPEAFADFRYELWSRFHK